VGLAIVLLVSSIAVGQGLDPNDLSSQTAATQPTSPPSPTQLRCWVAQLDDNDPSVREAALQDLLDLQKQDLPALRDAALALKPLSSGQIVALGNVVSQIFLAAEEYPPDLTGGYPCGFLGMRWDIQDQSDDGVVVAERFPGLAAYRLLKPGDIILKLADHPNIELRHFSDFTEFVGLMHPGDVLRLELLRYGRVIHVSLPLVPRPQALAPDRAAGNIDNWLQTRSRQASQYWKSQFYAIYSDNNASGVIHP
jgi:hypothetical protein